jgi:WD40 repeat protein
MQRLALSSRHSRAFGVQCFVSSSAQMGENYGSIRVWSTNNVVSVLFDINAHHGFVESVVWTAPSNLSLHHTTKQSSFGTRQTFGTQIGQPCTSHTHDINSLAISSDASFAATVSFDKTVRLWSTESHKQIGQRLKHTTRVSSVAISPNGELLVSGEITMGIFSSGPLRTYFLRHSRRIPHNIYTSRTAVR